METTCFVLSVSTYLYVEPFNPEPASVATATNGLKGNFPLKYDHSGKKRLQLPVTPQVKAGSMHRLCVCVSVWESALRSNVLTVLQTVHVFAMLSYISCYFGLLWSRHGTLGHDTDFIYGRNRGHVTNTQPETFLISSCWLREFGKKKKSLFS